MFFNLKFRNSIDVLISTTSRFINTIHYSFGSCSSVSNILPQLAFFHSSLLAKCELSTPHEQLIRVRLTLKLIQRSFLAHGESNSDLLSILDIVASFWRKQYSLQIPEFEISDKSKISLEGKSLRMILAGVIRPMIDLFGLQKWVEFFLQFRSCDFFPGHGVPGKFHQEGLI